MDLTHLESKILHSSAISSLRGSPTSWSHASAALPSQARHRTSGSTSRDAALEGHDIGPYIPKVRAVLGAIIKSCHATYGNLLMTSSKISTG